MAVRPNPYPSTHCCQYCRGSTIVLQAETQSLTALLRCPSTAYRIRYGKEGEHRYRYEVVQCTKCKAEAPVLYGGSPGLWRKRPRWWSDIDSRFRESAIKQREAERRQLEHRQKETEQYLKKMERQRLGMARQQFVEEILSNFWKTKREYRFHFLSTLQTSHGLKPAKQFEICVGHLFERNRYSVKITGSPGDRGIDILASKNDRTFPVQCKRWNKEVSSGCVRDFLGALHQQRNVRRGVIISWGGFSKPAINSALEVIDKAILLVDSRGLNLMLTDFYRFEQEYLFKFGVKTAFVGPSPLHPSSPPQQVISGQAAPSKGKPLPVHVSLHPQQVCLTALAIVPDHNRPQVGGTTSGYFWRRQKRLLMSGQRLASGDRYYCLYTKNGKVHEGECNYDETR